MTNAAPPSNSLRRGVGLVLVLLMLLLPMILQGCPFYVEPETSEAHPRFTPLWSPDGTHIVFTWSSEIYVVASDGSRIRRVSGKDGTHYSPDISPDGTRIAYITTRFSREDGKYAMFAIEGVWTDFDIATSDLDGSDTTRLTEDSAQDISPAWSPDDRHIAFIRYYSPEKGIYTMAPDGSDLRLVLCFLGWQGPHAHSGPRWSPDGKMFAFVIRERGYREVEARPLAPSTSAIYEEDDEGRIWEGLNREALYTMGADGSGMTRILDMSNRDRDLILGSPEWSPDGDSIAFITYKDGHFRVNTINPDGSGLREVAKIRSSSFGFGDNSLSWSPDSTKILFSASGINIVNEDGSGLRKVADGRYASWSPNSSRITVVSGLNKYRHPKEDFSLVTIAPDGSDRQALVTEDKDGDLKAVNAKFRLPWMALGIAGGVILAIVGLLILRRILRRRRQRREQAA